MEEQIVLSYLLKYLKQQKIPHKKSGKIVMLQCPFCKKKPMSANIIPNTYIVNCFNCKQKYNIIDIANKIKNLNGDKKKIIQYLKEELNIKIVTELDEENIENYLNFYEKNGFDLVPVIKNGKRPIEQNWTNKTHKNKNEWKQWIMNGLNIGVKTGLKSNITVIDIDTKDIDDKLKRYIEYYTTQKTQKGYHLFFKYEPDLPKTRIDDLKIDIENDGGQVVLAPSIVNGHERKIFNDHIEKMPLELKELLLSKVTIPRKTKSEKVKEDIQTENFNLGVLKEGQRNSSLIRLGGILRKELNLVQTEFVLKVLNRHLCENPLQDKEIIAMINSLDKYTRFDEEELAHRIVDYIKDIEEANRNEIAMALVGTNRGEQKKRVDKALQYLVKEGYITKKGSRYSILKKVEWIDTLLDIGKPIDFKMPYFYDIANFNFGDLILIGSKNKKGKTHIAMNIVKQLVEQGIKPCYINLESGSRFAKIALQLGLKEGDFKRPKHIIVDPTKIELEQNAITIIDWLCPQNFAEVDKLFLHFIEQLDKTHGILIVFMQLKGSKSQNNEWFAPNLVSQFPALSARYIYDNEGDGEYGKFIIDEIRDPKLKIKTYEIPCQYNWETKELKRIDEIEEESSE